MKFTIVSALAAFGAVASAQSITVTTTPSPAQATKIVSDLSSYFNSLTAQPAWTSFLSAAQSYEATATNLPTPGAFNADSTNWGAAVSEFNSAMAAPSPSGVPSDLYSYVKSIAGAEASIINKDAGSGAPARSQGLLLSGLAAVGTVVYIAYM